MIIELMKLSQKNSSESNNNFSNTEMLTLLLYCLPAPLTFFHHSPNRNIVKQRIRSIQEMDVQRGICTPPNMDYPLNRRDQVVGYI